MEFHASDNRFTSQNNIKKIKTITENLKAFGIEVVCFGYDGDSKFLKSQKVLMNFGIAKRYREIIVCADWEFNDFFGNQDPLHITKNMKNRFYDTSNDILMGNYVATYAHLIIVVKMFPKIEHSLSISDLNPNDRMNYE